jgi:hypothetical protein
MREVMTQACSRMWGWAAVGLLVLGTWGCAGDVPADEVPAEEAPADEAPAEVVPAEEAHEEEEPAGEPDGAHQPAADLDAGWSVIEGFTWPVEPGCCGMNTVGPTSPEGPIPSDGWPADGYYEATARRLAESPTMIRLTVRRWVTCSELPHAPCIPDPEPDPVTGEDPRITGDPASEVVREVPIEDIRVVLIPIHDFDLLEQRALEGEPGAFATLLSSGIDVAYRRWVYEPYLAGTGPEAIQRDLLERSADPDFPFGMDYCGAYAPCGPVAYRGPFGTSILADPTWSAWEHLARWPPGPEGLYGWQVVTLEVRDGEPNLYVWAGPIAG